MTRLTDLPPEQVAALRAMQRDMPDMDEVGQRMNSMDKDLVHAVDELAKLKLATWVLGQNMKVWFRLTQKGQKLLDEGNV